MAHRYQRTAEERKFFDDLLLEVIAGGATTNEAIHEQLRTRLIRTGEDWAKAVARSNSFPNVVRSSIYRLRDEGVLVCTQQSRRAKWEIVPEARRAHV